MNKLPLFSLNLKSSGGWKIETNKHQQIIALTTQLNEMETAVSLLAPGQVLALLKRKRRANSD